MKIGIASLVMASGFAWGTYEYVQSEKSEVKVEQYEKYLSNNLMYELGLLTSDLNSVESYMKMFIDEQKVESEKRAIFIGRLYEAMDLAQKIEELAITLGSFENKSPSYQTSQTMYTIGLYLSNLSSTSELSDKDKENLDYIYQFISEWTDVTNKALPEFQTEDGLAKYFEKYQDSIINEKDWIVLINNLDKKTTSLLKEKKVDSLETFLYGEVETNEDASSSDKTKETSTSESNEGKESSKEDSK